MAARCITWTVSVLLQRPGGFSTADIYVGQRSGAGFSRAANSAALMAQINTAALEYAPAVSASQLELYFTRLEGSATLIYGATRRGVGEPFGAPIRIDAINGTLAEGPTLSPDEKSLYYHQSEGGRFVIYRVSRP